MEIILKRVYEKASPKDGYRVLVDRIWPRGVSKEDAELNEWNKELAPSTELRKWFHRDSNLWLQFAEQYEAELQHSNAAKIFIDKLKKQEKITLVYAAKDDQHCHPIVLKKHLETILKNN